MNITLPSQYDFLSRFSYLAIANVLSNIMVPLAGTISVANLCHLSQIDYLAGVSLSTTLFNFIYFIFGFLRMGTTGALLKLLDAMTLRGCCWWDCGMV